ncbi:MAG: hypothetical protein JNJ52_12280 [Flavobacterium sp.]|nr:hypothetical protein [Flavobacterium sp.]
MKKILNSKLSLSLLFSALLLTSCEKDDFTGDSTLEVATDVVGTISLTSPLTTSQNVREADEDSFSYTITLNKPQSKDIHISVIQVSGTADGDDFEFDNDIVIPAYSLTGSGTITIHNDDLQEGDENFTLKIGNINTSNASVPSATVTFVITDCYSDLAGTYNYSTTNVSAPTGEFAAGPLTGTVTFTQTASGVYSLSDASFGGWIGLYGAGNIATGVSFTDTCGTLAYSGSDQFGEVFTISNLVISGPSMSFHWENDYGEFGDTTLTRPDGSNWPALTLN